MEWYSLGKCGMTWGAVRSGHNLLEFFFQSRQLCRHAIRCTVVRRTILIHLH